MSTSASNLTFKPQEQLSLDTGPLDYKRWAIVTEEEVNICTACNEIQTKWIGDTEWSFTVSPRNSSLYAVSAQFIEEDSQVQAVEFLAVRCRVGKQRYLVDYVRRQEMESEENEFPGPSGNYKRKELPNKLVVRILKKRPECSLYTIPNESPGTAVMHLEDQKFYVDKEYLSRISPIFGEQFHGEGATAELTIQNVKPTHFEAFLHAIAPRDRVPPNPSNVIPLASLAHKFDVQPLLVECERCLRLAHEIPILDRLLLADQLDLVGTRAYILSLMSDREWIELLKDGDNAKKATYLKSDVLLEVLRKAWQLIL